MTQLYMCPDCGNLLETNVAGRFWCPYCKSDKTPEETDWEN